ncbi:MAG: Uma2 family endonuclease, partial [Lamprobacter sp.]|uniref:Uma2 family endonuclease n=1 Tax=Lamprobacter sp. TaxID=3100796 RepID=UPI002B25ADBD
MTNLAHSHRLSVDDYLAAEDGADSRHEYIGGERYAMTGASDRHGLITLNLATFLRPRLRGTPCQLFANDMKVRLKIADQLDFGTFWPLRPSRQADRASAPSAEAKFAQDLARWLSCRNR